jgi:flagellar hook-length control protein FliK
MISLGSEIEEVFSQVKPQGVASQIPNFQDVLRGDNSVATNLNLLNGTRLDLSFKPGIEMETNIDHEHLIRRQEQYLHASRRLAAALGERLAAQISKGAWRVEMDLHPKSLGRIEIQLEMRNGDLEAYFNPSQNITRDLLLESFSKLRDVLSEHGIDSAYIGLGSGKKQDSDGKPTEAIATLDDRDESEFDSNTSMATSLDQTITSDGLDIKV